MNESLLSIDDLSVSFPSAEGRHRVVDGVSLSIPRGKTVALVGESGCGKSVTALSVLRLLPQPPARVESGRILLAGREGRKPAGRDGGVEAVDLLALPGRRIRRVRGRRVAMIFQDPMSAMNPVYTVGEQIIETLRLHRGLGGRRARQAAADLLRDVGIADPAARLLDHPHKLSGGMLQRAMIAMMLACEPDLLIADEPTTALDVTVQRQILALLTALQRHRGMSVLLITHDLSVVADVAHYTYVMYAGRIVEHGPTRAVLDEPLHPYTQALLACTPSLEGPRGRLPVIPGQVPAADAMPTGCRFHPRCPLTADRAGDVTSPSDRVTRDGRPVLRRCVEEDVPLRELQPGHFAACWLL